MKCRKAFTLIELLVVIAIIAILAAILFPVFAAAREKARITQCASNMKQIGLAFIQYTQDYDECPPCGVNVGAGNMTANYGGMGWAGQLYPYLKSTGVLACPDDPTQTHSGTWVGVTVSYAYNGWNMGKPDSTATFMVMYSDAKWNAPASTVAFTEFRMPPVTGANLAAITSGYEYWTTPGGFYSPTSNGPYSGCWFNGLCGAGFTAFGIPDVGGAFAGYTGSTPTITAGAIPTTANWRHNGANYLFCDGHVKFLMPSVVSVGKNPSLGSATSNAIYAPTYTAAGTQGFFADGVTVPAATYSIY